MTGVKLFSEEISVIPNLTTEDAIDAAKRQIPATSYLWQCEQCEQHLKERTENIDATYYPTPRLVIFQAKDGKAYLAYKMNISGYEPSFSFDVFISAVDGALLEKRNKYWDNTPASGTASLHIYGTKSINTTLADGTYVLFDQIRNIKTYNVNNQPNIEKSVMLRDNDNNWTIAEYPEADINSVNSVTTSHWAAQTTYDFFKSTFNLNGYSNTNPLLVVYANYGGAVAGANASWGNGAMQIGSGCPFFDEHHFGVLDIVAHEYGHAITESVVDIEYQGESGAVNESLSDIWAACVDSYASRSKSQIWQMGEDRGSVVRDMSNPNATEQPDTYGGQYWVNPDTTYDRGGVHINSGVMNYWFYLLVNGGSGTNDNFEKYAVKGIGFQKAEKIVYNALNLYFTQSTNFEHARTTTLAVASNLYGQNSNEYISVANAWNAVGVGVAYLPQTISGEFGVCDDGVYFLDNFPPAATVTWSSDKFEEPYGSYFSYTTNKVGIVSGQNTPTVTVNKGRKQVPVFVGTPNHYVGEAKIYANITYRNFRYSISKDVFVNSTLTLDYKVSNPGGVFINPMQPYIFYTSKSLNPKYLKWTIKVPGYGTTIKTGVNEVTVSQYSYGTIVVTVTDEGGCAADNIKTVSKIIPKPVELNQNPVRVGDNIEVFVTYDEALTSLNAASRTTSASQGRCIVELWNNSLGKLSQKEADASVSFSTVGFTPGVYFVRLIFDNVVICTENVIVI